MPATRNKTDPATAKWLKVHRRIRHLLAQRRAEYRARREPFPREWSIVEDDVRAAIRDADFC